MNETLGAARRPARINNEKRIREVDPLKPQLRIPTPLPHKLLPGNRPRHIRDLSRPITEPGLGDQALEFPHPVHTLNDLGHLGPQVDGASVVDGEVVDKDPARTDLGQAVEDACDAHVGAGAAEEAASARGGEEHGQRVEAVACHHGDAVALFEAVGAHGVGEDGDAVAERRPGQVLDGLGEGAFAHGDAGGFVVFFVGLAGLAVQGAGEEDVFGEVELHAREPGRDGFHARGGVEDVVWAVGSGVGEGVGVD